MNKLKVNILWTCVFVAEVLLGATIIIMFFLGDKKLLLILSIFLISFAIILIKFRFGVYLLALLLPLDSQGFFFNTNWSNFTDVAPAFVPIALITLFSFFLFKFAHIDPENRTAYSESTIKCILFLIVAWSAICLIWPPDFYKSIIQEVRFIANIALFYIVFSSINDEAPFRKIIKILIFVGVVMAIAGLASVYIELENITPLLGVDVTDQIRFDFNFYSHSGVHAMGLHGHNALGSISNVIIAITIGMLFSTKKRRTRLFYFMIILLLLATHITTRSRGAHVGLFAMVTFLLVSIPSLREKFVIYSILFVLIVSFLYVVTLPEDESLFAKRYTASRSAQSLSFRLKWWKRASSYTFGQTSGIGMGVGGFKQRFSDRSKYPPLPHAHSLYFSYLFDFGVIGSFLFLIFLSVILKRIYYAMIGFQEKFENIMLFSCIGGLIALGVHGLIDGEYNAGLPWFLLGLTMAAVNLVNKDRDLVRMQPA